VVATELGDDRPVGFVEMKVVVELVDRTAINQLGS
jgi:hypothetical protein